MLARLVSRLTYANVVATLALFLALSTGVAYAANEWTGDNIVDGSLTGLDIAPDSLGTNKIKDENLTAIDLAPNSVGSSEIATDAVGASEIADDSIDGGELVDNSVTLTDIKGASKSGSVSFSAGAVANGRCRHFDVSVSGAATDEVVVFSTRATPPEGMIFYGVRVSSSGHVVLAVCNFTGGTSPAINSLPVHVATFG